jgi:hypothetical protein
MKASPTHMADDKQTISGDITQRTSDESIDLGPTYTEDTIILPPLTYFLVTEGISLPVRHLNALVADAADLPIEDNILREKCLQCLWISYRGGSPK